MAITKKGRITALALTVAGLLGAAGCGDSPTGIPEHRPVARDEQQVCIDVGGVRFCTALTAAALRDTTHP